MLIVIDTTETFQQPLLASPDWSYVQSLLVRDFAKLVVPEIVVAETLNHFPAKLTDSLKEARRALGRLQQLVPNSVVSVPELDVLSATDQYRIDLFARLKELRALRPDYKHIEIDRIVQRSLQHKKPFDADGKRGMRDSILWETVLEIGRLNDGEKIVLVTSNTNDFGPHGSPGPDLFQDPDNSSFATQQVTICADLHKFVESYVKPSLSKLDDLRLQIQEQSFDHFNVESFFADAFEEISAAVAQNVEQWDFHEIGFAGRNFESPRLDGLNASPEDYDVGDVYRTGVDEIAFSITFKLQGTIECDEENYQGPHVRPRTDLFTADAEFAVKTSQVMKESTGQITEFDVENVEIAPGYGWPYDEID